MGRTYLRSMDRIFVRGFENFHIELHPPSGVIVLPAVQDAWRRCTSMLHAYVILFDVTKDQGLAAVLCGPFYRQVLKELPAEWQLDETMIQGWIAQQCITAAPNPETAP